MSIVRKIRSFAVRGRALSTPQQEALEKLWPIFGLSYEQGLQDFNRMFGGDKKIVLEIGFGMGVSLLKQAQQHLEMEFIGIEVHRPGVAAMFVEILKNQIKNIHLYYHDAVEILEHCIPDQSLNIIQIFFPDPWPKQRHHKRRLIQTDFVKLLHKKLKPKGILHLATDVQDYAQHMMKVITPLSFFSNLVGENQYSPRPDFRPQTKFEQRGFALGNRSFDLRFMKVE